jgi:hypothetical protein
MLTALRGGDPSGDIATAAEMRKKMTDAQFEAYEHLARAWAAFTAGDYADAQREAGLATSRTAFFHAVVTPLAARAALWAGDAVGAGRALEALVDAGYRGPAVELDMATIRAGISALEGRTPEAVTAYREVLRGWRQLGLAFDEALAVTDMATLLPTDELASVDAQAAISWARDTLEHLGAKPILKRIGSARSASSAAAVHQRPERASADAPARSVT